MKQQLSYFFKKYKAMTTYSVILDRNTSSELLKQFENLELAKQFAIDELENTNPENDSEGLPYHSLKDKPFPITHNEYVIHKCQFQ